MSHMTADDISDTFGPFFGADVELIACEALAIAKIERKLLAKEAELYASKWFDYRALHPTMATYLMAHHYNREYGNYVGHCLDHSKRFMVGFKGKNVMATREVKAFWKLRQRIDQLGIRYDFFMQHAMAYFVAHGWTRPPRPAHMTSCDDMMVEVQNKWDVARRSQIEWASSRRFMACNFVGAADQVAYELHIVDAILHRPAPRFAIHTALYRHDALRFETALRLLPLEAIEAAIEIVSAESVSTEL